VVDLRAVRQRELGILLQEHLTEQLYGREQLGRRQLLVAEHEDRVLDKCLVQPVAGHRVGRLAQVEPAHLRAGMGRQLRDRAIECGSGHSAASAATCSAASERWPFWWK